MTHPTRRDLFRLAAASAAALPVLASRAAAQTTHTIQIQNFAFAPAAITIAAGDTVVFTNLDSAPHTASADGGVWDTGRLDQGGSVSITFSSPASFTYFCAFHPNMRGSITIV